MDRRSSLIGLVIWSGTAVAARRVRILEAFGVEMGSTAKGVNQASKALSHEEP